MTSKYSIPRAGLRRDAAPLDAARTAFEWLITGPHPVAVDGQLFPGLPNRRVPLNELRDRLLARRCPQTLRDAVWAHLVLRSRTEGATWTVGATGVALPALTAIAGKLTARFAGDPADIDAAVLTGFLAELTTIDLRKPRIMLRLRWAAYRAGYVAVREAFDAPAPSFSAFRSHQPPPPWGHPDFVLARAVAERAITAEEAELIGTTRLEGTPLKVAAELRGATYQAVKKARLRAEHRLVAYLLGDAPSSHADSDVARQAADAVVITSAARTASGSPSVTGVEVEKVRRRVSPKGSETGVRGCGRKPAGPAHTTTSEVPRCA
ncbi:hypothetical protein LWC34_44935 [Kibdelosporangium philippinense]|uniref:Sigma-70 family RNA polymerase sigma factor n=1 Tax=Kibdelosporangium philippinense TaxID=211113 RepID=A0ABS8ZQ72_9PSEU|nr:hypothetical protein [Kibdelosporangium philippinense]MCE7009904.1 hypothetical protein [Kibdelosporangium philippinense]